MNPTVFRFGPYRAFFFSREETRRHIHVTGPDGEAKFWLEPVLALADHVGLSARQLREIQRVIEENKNEIEKAWKAHFGTRR